MCPPWRATNAFRLRRCAAAVDAAQAGVELRCHRVERDAQLVQPRRGQRIAAPFVQQHAVGVEEHLRAPLLQMRHEARQLAVEQRLADPVQHRTLDDRNLIDDAAEIIPAQMVFGFIGQEMVVGQRARDAQRVAMVGDLDVELAGSSGIIRGRS